MKYFMGLWPDARMTWSCLRTKALCCSAGAAAPCQAGTGGVQGACERTHRAGLPRRCRSSCFLRAAIWRLPPPASQQLPTLGQALLYWVQQLRVLLEQGIHLLLELLLSSQVLSQGPLQASAASIRTMAPAQDFDLGLDSCDQSGCCSASSPVSAGCTKQTECTCLIKVGQTTVGCTVLSAEGCTGLLLCIMYSEVLLKSLQSPGGGHALLPHTTVQS